MDDTKQRNLMFIVIFLIVAIFVSIAIRNNSTFKDLKKDKKETNTTVEETFQDGSSTINQYPNTNTTTNNSVEKEIEEEKEQEAKEEPKIETNSSTKYYYSQDDKYYLVLTESKRRVTNGNDTIDHRYLLNIDNYLSTESITGTYSIDGNKITLTVEAGCMDKDGNFNCVIPDGITIVKKNNAINTMTLDYSDNTIKLGTVKLNIR
ncbi:MAG: hypothetical protein IJ193_03165 [Bacilli bacterium]|nr:hypothetical protein [Bacilli bacterium]